MDINFAIIFLWGILSIELDLFILFKKAIHRLYRINEEIVVEIKEKLK